MIYLAISQPRLSNCDICAMYFLGNKAEKLEQLVETSFVYHDIAFDHALAYLEPSEKLHWPTIPSMDGVWIPMRCGEPFIGITKSPHITGHTRK
jgi:hypothetical protein